MEYSRLHIQKQASAIYESLFQILQHHQTQDNQSGHFIVLFS